MQIRSTAAAGGASATSAKTPATSANGFARVMTAQTTTATKTVSGIRKSRPILVPKAAPTPTQQQAAVRTTMGLTEVLDRYGAGTLGSIMPRIRRI